MFVVVVVVFALRVLIKDLTFLSHSYSMHTVTLLASFVQSFSRSLPPVGNVTKLKEPFQGPSFFPQTYML